MDRDDAAYDGQREYTPLFLTIYDPLILGFFTPVVWRCPKTRLVEGYRRHLGHRHLDVGPGTGYFLAEPASLTADPSPSSTPTCTSSTMHPGGCSVWTSRPLRRTSASHCRSTGRSTPPRSAACSIACQGRSRARLPPSPTWLPSLPRRASSSVHRSSVPQVDIAGCRGAFSRPLTDGVPSTTSATPRWVFGDPRGIVRAGGAGDSARWRFSWPQTRRLARHPRSRDSALPGSRR